MKRPKGTWERGVWVCFCMCERYLSYEWNSIFSRRCVCVSNVSIFWSDVRVVGVSMIHREQLHISLREKQSRENV